MVCIALLDTINYGALILRSIVMRVGVPKESWPGENRSAMVPAHVEKLVRMGLQVSVGSGLGLMCGYADQDYLQAGATVENDDAKLLSSADVIVRVRPPSPEQVDCMNSGSIHVSFLDPFNQEPLIHRMSEKGITAISLEMIPRSTRAQKMDALSSQANLAGYVTVILAAKYLPKIFPMMMTPAGTISPARVFVIGAGVAGLQAIATAKRLGARVEAFDTRPVVAEQVQSLGAKFVQIDVGEVGQTEQGYAKELTSEQLALQREGMKRVIAQSDVVITTAQVFGRPAPRIVTEDMVVGMKAGSVVVDMAVDSGGNVEGSPPGEVVEKNGVKLVGLSNLPAEVARDASDMLSANCMHLLEEFWNSDASKFIFDPADDIAASCIVSQNAKPQ